MSLFMQYEHCVANVLYKAKKKQKKTYYMK